MGKFVIECPSCGTFTKASTGLFGSGMFAKKVRCTCGREIDPRKDRMTSIVCSSCGNNVVYNQKQGKKAKCPVCNAQLITTETMKAFIEVPCSSCGTVLHVGKTQSQCTCPICNTINDVEKYIQINRHKVTGEPVVIENGENNDFVIWKHPMTNFVTGSVLIVKESQQAIFFKNGEMLDSFGPGRHTLTTDILPLIKNSLTTASAGMESFTAEVYYVNMAVQANVKWGTPSKFSLFDPATGINVELGVNGTLNTRVSDPRKLLSKLTGTKTEVTIWDLFGRGPEVGQYKALIVTKVKSYLSRFVKSNLINVLEIDSYLDQISGLLKECINEDDEMIDYGLIIENLNVLTILLPEKEENPTFWEMRELYGRSHIAEQKANVARIEALTEQMKTIVKAQGEAAANQALGVSYAQKELLSAIQTAAGNKGTGGDITSAAMGLGVGFPIGMGLGNNVVDLMNNLLGNNSNSPSGQVPPAMPAMPFHIMERDDAENSMPNSYPCPYCGARIPQGSKFCNECGQKLETPKLICPKCNTENKSGSKFCWNCGERF